MRRQSKLDALRRESWWKPEFIALENQEIVWRLGDEVTVSEESISDCLVAFLKLSEVFSMSRFEAFAESYGVLNLDSKGRPLAMPQRGVEDLIDRKRTYRERVSQWRAYAQSAVLLIASANALNDSDDANGDLVLELLGWSTQFVEKGFGSALTWLNGPILTGSTLQDNRDNLAERLQRYWVSRSNLAPVFDWSDKSPTLRIHIGSPRPLIEEDEPPGVYWSKPSVFDVLTAALAEAILTNQRLTRCDNCGELMLMSRKARTDQPHYCPVCAPVVYRELNRELQRKRYQRRKEEQIGEN